MLPLLVFDLDGTLAETAGDLVGALNAAIVPEGLAPVAVAEARTMVGAGARALIQRAYAEQSRVLADGDLERLFRSFLAYYEDHIADQTTLFPGLVNALDRLEARGFAFAICTNKIESAARKLVTALGVAGRFRAVCGQDTFGVAKPDPRILTGTIERAGRARAEAIMIGDSGADVATARAAGVPCIAVDFGYSDRPVHEFAPDVVISRFDALDAAVEQIRTRGGSRSRPGSDISLTRGAGLP